jgi:hypothetical protein
MTHGHGTTLGHGSTLGHGYILVWKQSTVLHSLTNRCVIHDGADGADGIEFESRDRKMKKKGNEMK